MIDYRLSRIISKSKQKLSFSEVERITGIDENELNETIELFNQISIKMFNKELSVENNEVVIPEGLSRIWSDLFFKTKRNELILVEEERQAMIYLLSFAQVEELSVYFFQEFLQVSKNTILKDLKNLRTYLSNKKLTLEYSRKTGFYLHGDEAEIRSTAFYLLGNLMNSQNGQRLLYDGLFCKSTTLYSMVRMSFSKTVQAFELVFVPSRFDEMVYFIAYLICRIERHEILLKGSEQKFLKPLTMYQASRYFLQDFSGIKNVNQEIYYFTIAFMTVMEGEIQDPSLEFLLVCASGIIHEIERLAAIEFKNYRKLLLDLFYHLVPAYFRIKYNFKLNNVLIDEIKIQYSEIFEITKVALFPLKKIIQKSIPDEEIGYFTILFGGEIRIQRENKQDKPLKALILCPSGISSSLIMKSELKELFPQIDFTETSSFDNFDEQETGSRYDLIFSSVPIKTSNILYVINPIMTQLEKNTLFQKVQEDFLVPKVLLPSINEILDLLLPYIELKNGVTREKLYRIVQRKVNKEMKRREDNRPMLTELLTKDTIQLTDQELTWQEAIELAAEPLKISGKIEPKYTDAMIKKVNDNGPFIHIGKGVALPHARPEEGVNELGMSLLKVNKPVLLLDDEKHPIQIFICLAAIDNEMHLKALAGLTRILSNKETLDQLLEAATKEEMITIIAKGENQ
ncbi:BglG family transcription antiterminator [Enterococcus sp. LJL99]